MLQEIPRNLGPAIESFNARHNPKKSRKSEIIEGGSGPGLYRMRVEKTNNHLRIDVKNEYEREFHLGEKKPFFSGFSLGVKLNNETFMSGVDGSFKDGIKVTTATVKNNGLSRSGLIETANELADRRGKGIFIVGVDMPPTEDKKDGEKIELVYYQDEDILGKLKTIIRGGRIVSGKEDDFMETLEEIGSVGLAVPTLIDIFKTAERLLGQKLTPREMRESPFVEQKLHWNERRNYERASEMLGGNQN